MPPPPQPSAASDEQENEKEMFLQSELNLSEFVPVTAGGRAKQVSDLLLSGAKKQMQVEQCCRVGGGVSVGNAVLVTRSRNVNE